MLRFSANLLDSFEYEMDNGKFVFRNFLAKCNVKTNCLFCSLINFLAMENRTR